VCVCVCLATPGPVANVSYPTTGGTLLTVNGINFGATDTLVDLGVPIQVIKL